MIINMLDLPSKSVPSKNLNNSNSSKLQDFSCQTELEGLVDFEFPIFFCTLHASYNEAATQCNIPCKITKEKINKADTRKEELVSEKNKKRTNQREELVQQTIEAVIRSGKDSSDTDNFGDGFDSCDPEPDTVEAPGTDKPSEGTTFDTAKPTQREYEETKPREKKGKYKKRKKIKDEDFSSDDDTEFWRKMALVRKSKKIDIKKTSENHNYSSDILLPEIKQELVSENEEIETVPEHFEMDGDWITDDEEDEKEIDLEAAFREEWKKRRLPAYSKERPFMCEVCGKLYSKNHLLREHVVKIHGDHQQALKYPYQCKHCKRVYAGEKQLQVHSAAFSGPCEKCGVIVGCSGLFWVHRKTHEGECSYCEKTFCSKNTLMMHIKTKHTEKKLECKICQRKFTFESQLKRHIKKRHSADEPKEFTCKQCNFSTNRKTALRAHERSMHEVTHKVYSCNDCEGTFKSKILLEGHSCDPMRNGSWTCKICMQTFPSSHKLKMHIKRDHNIPRILNVSSGSGKLSYICQVCTASFSSQEDLRVHTLEVHGIIMEDDAPQQQQHPEAIQASDAESNDVTVMHIDINSGMENPLLPHSSKSEEPIIEYPSVGITNIRSALSLPACVIPPDVNLVEIDGVQYQVVRGNH